MVCLRCQLFFLFCFISLVPFAQGSLVSEVVGTGPLGTTHRLYFQADTGAEVLSIFASDDHPIEISSTTAFHQEIGLGAILPLNGLLLPASNIDSWFTIGEPLMSAVSSVGGGDWNVALASFENGGHFTCADNFGGAFYLTPGSGQGVISGSNILLGQFTSTGSISVLLNVQWRPSSGGDAIESTDLTVALLPADAGCTDGNALNYDMSASADDGSCAYAENGFSGLTWAQHGVSEDGVPVYRIWAELSNPNEQVVSIIGDAMNPLEISSTAPFFQAMGGGVLPLGLSPDDELVIADSWVTIGTDMAGGGTQTVGLTTALFESGYGLLSDPQFGGGWFVIPGMSSGAFPDESGRVLLAQLTTEGLVQFDVSLAYQNEGGDLQEEWGLSLTFPEGLLGCMDSLSCNFNPAATLGDVCLIEDALGVCGGECSSDVDEDGICDNDEILGCNDVTAVNFDVSVTENDGSCLYSPLDPDTSGFLGVSHLLVAEDLVLGSKTYRAYAQFDGPGYELLSIFGNEVFALAIASEAGFHQSPLGGPLANSIPGGNVFDELNADTWLTIGGDDASTASSLQSIGINFSSFESGGELHVNSPSGGAVFVVPGAQASATSDSTGTILIGQFTSAGQVEMTVNLQFKTPNGEVPDVRGVNMTFPDIVTGCIDPEACNLDIYASEDDGSCVYPFGYPLHVFDCEGGCLSDLDGDGVCDADEVPGCTDPLACNYEIQATDDDGSCTTPLTQFGTDEVDCEGNCLLDSDEDGTCDGLEVEGCTNPWACNYSDEATDEDGSCEYLTCAGCLDPVACNFDSIATIGNGTCVYANAECEVCSEGEATVLDADGDGICDANEYDGCADSAACNYDQLIDASNAVNGDCIYPLDLFGTIHVTCDGVCLSDQDGDGICDPDEILGCTYGAACNFLVEATQEDGTCIFAEPLRTCDGGCLLDLNNDGVCDDLSDFGCTYAEAYNFNVNSTVDDGSCVFPQGSCQADLNSDGEVTVTDLLEFLVYFTTSCE